MPLLNLPNEVLLNVASCFIYDADINAFMQVNCRLYYLLYTDLYRHNIRHQGSSALEWGARNGMVRTVQKMLDEGVSQNHRFREDKEYLEPMGLAVRHGHDDVVKLLLERGVHPDPTGWIQPVHGDRNKKKREGQDDEDELKSPLCQALAFGQESVLQILLAHAKALQTSHMTDRQRVLLHKKSPGEPALKIPVEEGFAEELMAGVSGEGHLSSVKFLAEHEPDTINGKSFEIGGTPLTEAARCNQTEVLRFLLSAGADPNLTHEFEWPLQSAAKNGDVEAVQLLLNNGACPDPCTSYPYKAHSLEILNDAAKGGHAAVVKLLLQHIDIRSKMVGIYQDRDVLITTAATFGFMDIVQQILEGETYGNKEQSKGKRIFLHDTHMRTPLALAAENSHRKIVALLLDHGGDPDPDICGTYHYHRLHKYCTPLIIACSKGRADIVKLLLDGGSSLYHEGWYGLSTHGIPIHKERSYLGMAALRCAIQFPVIFQLILDRGVHPEAEALDSFFLMAEVVSSGNISLVQLLLDQGVQLRVPSEYRRYGKKLMDYAVQGGPSMLDYLSMRGAIPVNPEDDHVKSAFWDAVNKCNYAVVNYFLEQGCDPNSREPGDLDNASRTPGHSCLEAAAQAKDPEGAAITLDVLLHHGAIIDDLLGACDWNCCCTREKRYHLRVVQLLLERDANPCPVSAWGQNTLMQAVCKNHQKVIHLLLQKICACGIPLDNLRLVLRTIEDQVDAEGDWRFWRFLESLYLRQKYPVP